MLRSIDILKVMTCLSALALAAPAAYAADNQFNPNCGPGVENCAPNQAQAPMREARDPSKGTAIYNKLSDPNCTPNIPNCYTYEPSGNVSKEDPTKSPTKSK